MSRTASLDDASREVEMIKAFRDTWELGIHSYLALLARPADRREGPLD